LEAGLHLVSVTITPPAGTTVVSVDPPQLGIALTLRQQ
jgi:hypothetical protein